MPTPVRAVAVLGFALLLALLTACGGAEKPAASPPASEPPPPPAAEEQEAIPLDPERAVFSHACLDLKPAEVKGGMKPPAAMVRQQPELPGGQRVTGTVVLEVIVDEKGAVCDARVITGVNPRLDRSCIESVKTWVFRPARRRGDPVAVFSRVKIAFDTT